MPGIENKESWQFIKARIIDPKLFTGEFRYKVLSEGISAVMGFLKDNPEKLIIQSYRFDKKKGWTVEKVSGWIKDNEIQILEIANIKEFNFEKRIYTKRINEMNDITKKKIKVVVWKDIVSISNGDAENEFHKHLVNRVSIGIDGGTFEEDGIEFIQLIYLKDFGYNRQEDFIHIPKNVIITEKEIGEIEIDELNETVLDSEMILQTDLKIIDFDEEQHLATAELLRVGQWEHPHAEDGLMKITPELFEELLINFQNKIMGKELPLDFGHKPDSTQTPGWIIKMDKVEKVDTETNETIIQNIITMRITDITDLPMKKSTWTLIKEGSLKYISPSILLNFRSPADGKNYNVVKGAALTNYPHIKNMEEIKPINFEEIKKEEVREIMNLEELKKLIEAKNIKFADAVKMLIELNSATDISDEDKLNYSREIIWATQDYVDELERAMKSKNEAIKEVELKLKVSTEKIVSMEEQIKQFEKKVIEAETKIPENSVLLSCEEYKKLIASEKQIDAKVQEMIFARIEGTTKEQIDSQFAKEIKHIESIQEMLGTKKIVGKSTTTSSPQKKKSSDYSEFFVDDIAKKMEVK